MTPKVVGHIDLDKPKAAKAEPAKEPVEELANEPAIQPVDKPAAELRTKRRKYTRAVGRVPR